MKRKIFSILILLVVIFSFIPLFIPQKVKADFIKDGNAVYTQTNNTFIKVTPHTLTTSGWVEVQFMSTKFTGDVDIVFGFNGIDQVQTVKMDTWEAYDHVKTRQIDAVLTATYKPNKVSKVKSLTKNSKFAEIGDNNLNALLAEIDVEESGIEGIKNTTKTKTIAYESYNSLTGEFTYKYNGKKVETYVENYVDWKPSDNQLGTEIKSFSGSDKWQGKKYSQSVISNNFYTARFWVDIPFKGKESVSGKYNVAIKPSNLTLDQAISSNNIAILDPWYNASWSYRKSFTYSHASGALTNYQQMIKVYYGSGSDGTESVDGMTAGKVYTSSHCQTDFDDIRFTKSDGTTLLDYWLESKTDSNNAIFWVELDSVGTGATTFYIYYGNAGASSSSSGSNTFIKFDDFEWGNDEDNIDTSGGSITWSKAVGAGCSAKIDTSQYYTGTRSLRLYRNGADYAIAICSQTAGANYAIRYRLRKDTNAQFVFFHGNGTKLIYGAWVASSEDIYYYDGALQDTGANATVDVWQLYEDNDIDFSNNYDMWFQGSEIKANAGLHTDSSASSQIWFIDNDGTSYVWIDNVVVRYWVSTEPALGSWGSEDVGIPTVTTNAASSIGDTYATGNGNITDVNIGDATVRGFEWDIDSGAPYANDVHENGSFSTGAYTLSLTSLPTGKTIYYRAYATNVGGTGYGSEQTFLTKPAAPTNVAATDGTFTTKVVVTWTKSTGATGYRVYRDTVDISGLLGDVATYDDTTAGAPTITPGTASATDGTSAAHVTLSIAGESAANGTTHTYYVVASNATGNSSDSATDTGYRGTTTLTYQWLRSAADSDAAFGNIAGGTTNPYNDTGGVAYPDGRYYYCTVSMSGATSQDTTHDRGFMGIAPTVSTGYCTGFSSDWAVVNGSMTNVGYPTTVTTRGFDYGLTTGYGSSYTTTGFFSTGAFFNYLSSLSPGTVYHYRAKALNGSGWGYGVDRVFATKGSPTPYVTFNTGDDGEFSIYGVNYGSQTFTVPASYAYTVTSLNLKLLRVGNPGTINIQIKRTSAGSPTGEVLCSATLNGDNIDTSATWYKVTMDTEYPLEANTVYAIIISAPSGDGSNYVKWRYVAAGGYAGGNALTSTDSGVTWSAQTYDFLFEVWGNPCIQIESVKIYNDYQSSGDWLITILYKNVYPPYYINKSNVKQYFALQLVDSGGNVKSQVACPEWDYKPASIYLKASQVIALTWGGTYYIRLQGLFTGTPYIEYAIQSTDWIGSDMTNLDNWVLTSADVLGDYYGVTMTTYVADRGKCCNSTGGVIFSNGICALSTERPNLFQINTQGIQHSISGTSGSGAGETVTSWQAVFGTYVVEQLTNAGSVFGVNGQAIGAWILICFMGILMAWGLPSGHVAAANVLALPIFFMGLGLRLFDWATGAVFLALMILLLWYNLWLKNG